eukprot:TRINITY_DN15874_c0_g2_i2.p1 TRINITY_DN15874_c0_g2~~TRINITY_DN15874_c0_g2_i2.p1  ORF type:complete len:193 (+),score=33.69 TRINITY_DN15874_c0_g2_i2:102-680(+)
MSKGSTHSPIILPESLGDDAPPPPPPPVGPASDISVFVSNILLRERLSVAALLEKQHSMLLRDLRSILAESSVFAKGALNIPGERSDHTKVDVADVECILGNTSEVAPPQWNHDATPTESLEGGHDIQLDLAERAEALDKEARDNDPVDAFRASAAFPEFEPGSYQIRILMFLEIISMCLVAVTAQRKTNRI